MMNEYFFFSSTQGTKLDFERCSSSGVGWEGNGSSEDGPEKVWHPARGSVGGSQEIFVLTHLGQKALPYNLLTNIDYHDPVFYSVIMVKTMIKKKVLLLTARVQSPWDFRSGSRNAFSHVTSSYDIQYWDKKKVKHPYGRLGTATWPPVHCIRHISMAHGEVTRKYSIYILFSLHS